MTSTKILWGPILAVSLIVLATVWGATRYVAAQGTMLGRTGRVHLKRDDAGDVWVGGRVRTEVNNSQSGLVEESRF